MPELPDMEVFGHYLNDTALHKTIQDVHVADATVPGNISAVSLRMDCVAVCAPGP